MTRSLSVHRHLVLLLLQNIGRSEYADSIVRSVYKN